MSASARRRRVLLVVGAWRPAMIADMQRARLLAWELPAQGWDVEVLTPRASEIRQDVIEPDADAFFAPDIPAHEVGSLARGAFEAIGSAQHAWRTLLPLWRRGSELLRDRRFDLVYFTSTAFSHFSLGAHWVRRYGVPFVLDFHDPWVVERRSGPVSWRKSGWRSRMNDRLAERMERSAIGAAAGVVAVSPTYIEMLKSRYASAAPRCLSPDRHAVIPFGAREAELAETAAHLPSRKCDVGQRSYVLRYTGAGGRIMARSFTLICKALAALRESDRTLVDSVRIELYGTMYGWKPGDPRLLEAIATDSGVGDIVREHPGRVTYRRSLELLLDSDGALILGVDDAGYTPSKLVAYALSGKPLLASLRRDGPAHASLVLHPGLGHSLWFDRAAEMPVGEALPIVRRYLEEVAAKVSFDRRPLLEPFLAPRMASLHAALFDACLSGS